MCGSEKNSLNSTKAKSWGRALDMTPSIGLMRDLPASKHESPERSVAFGEGWGKTDPEPVRPVVDPNGELLRELTLDPSAPTSRSPQAEHVSDVLRLHTDADERTRTSTWLPRHGPEPCASTNSATSAPWRQPTISHTRDLASGQAGSLRPRRSRAPALPYLEALVASRYPPLSSRGLGRRPLMAETRVRIPVAVLTDALRIAGFRRSKGDLCQYSCQCCEFPARNRGPRIRPAARVRRSHPAARPGGPAGRAA